MKGFWLNLIFAFSFFTASTCAVTGIFADMPQRLSIAPVDCGLCDTGCAVRVAPTCGSAITGCGHAGSAACKVCTCSSKMESLVVFAKAQSLTSIFKGLK